MASFHCPCGRTDFIFGRGLQPSSWPVTPCQFAQYSLHFHCGSDTSCQNGTARKWNVTLFHLLCPWYSTVGQSTGAAEVEELGVWMGIRRHKMERREQTRVLCLYIYICMYVAPSFNPYASFTVTVFCYTLLGYYILNSESFCVLCSF